MEHTYTENETALWSAIEPIVYAAIKDAPAMRKLPDGTYHYEVNPIPGDYIDMTADQTALAAKEPDAAIVQAISGKYLDAIDAAEQALYLHCCEMLKAEYMEEEGKMISLLLSQKVFVHPPISYYKEQLNRAGERL